MAGRSVVRLGYVRTTYPVLNECALRSNWITSCQLPGIAMEMWKELSERLNFDIELVQVPQGYGSIVDGAWTGMIGLLVNGTIDATVGFIAFTSERYEVIRYSVPLSQWDNGFVSQEPVGAKLQLSLQAYDYSVFLLFAAFFAVVSLFEWHRLSTVSDAVWSALSALCFQLPSHSRVLRNPLMMLGWLCVAIGYFAGFRSQTIMSGLVSPPFQTMAEAQRKFGSGVLTVVTSHSVINVDALYADSKLALEHPPLIVESQVTTVQLLCSRPDLVYFGDTGALGSIWHVESPCHLQRVPILDRAIGMGSNFLAIGFRKNFSLYASANEILMRLFSIDHIESYMANKYISEFPQRLLYDRYFLPIYLSVLEPACYLLIAGFIIALLVAVCERIVDSSHLK